MFDLEEDDEPMEVQMAPLIDCVFLLLIFFLVTSTMHKVSYELPLNLPEAAQTVQAAPAPTQLVVAVDAAGQTFINATPVTNDQMLAQIKQAAEPTIDPQTGEPGLHVRVDGDARAPYGQVVRVIDQLSAMGIRHIGLKTLGPTDVRKIEKANPR